MKNTTTNFKINVAEGTIEMTSKVNKAIQKIGSNEYLELVQLRKDFPDFRIIVKTIKKKEGKKTYSGLTLKEMERFVSTVGKNELAVFKKVVEIANHKKGSYAIIKKWFLNKYKEAYEAELENIKLEKELNDLEAELDIEETEEELGMTA